MNHIDAVAVLREALTKMLDLYYNGAKDTRAVCSIAHDALLTTERAATQPAGEEPGWAYGRTGTGTPNWTKVQDHAEACGGRLVGNKLSFPTSAGKALFDAWYAENASPSLRVRSVFKPFAAPISEDTASECTCPSGDGSLRWPCPAHPVRAMPISTATPATPSRRLFDPSPLDEYAAKTDWSKE